MPTVHIDSILAALDSRLTIGCATLGSGSDISRVVHLHLEHRPQVRILIILVRVLVVVGLIAGWLATTTRSASWTGTFEMVSGKPVVNEGQWAVAVKKSQQLLVRHPGVGVVPVGGVPVVDAVVGATGVLSALVGHVDDRKERRKKL
ncbi:hypothetical protein N7540_001593 [Penicillium herquei]|nr:hypothetical protein N7540_001593 [Penicillium herquei]